MSIFHTWLTNFATDLLLEQEVERKFRAVLIEITNLPVTPHLPTMHDHNMLMDKLIHEISLFTAIGKLSGNNSQSLKVILEWNLGQNYLEDNREILASRYSKS